MKIKSNQDCVVRSSNPYFKYRFSAGKPVEVDDKHAEKILKNPSFVSDKTHTKCNNLFTFENELSQIKGIGNKTAKDIVKVYKDQESLLEAIKQSESLPFRDDVADKLRNHYTKYINKKTHK